MSLYSPAEQSSNVVNGSRNMTDGSGTINPAALNSGVLIPQSHSELNSRGLKRSRSPDDYGDYVQVEGHDDSKPRKRGRPAKTPRTSGDFSHDQSGALPTPSSQASPGPATTPGAKSQAASAQPAATPTKSSPGPRATPKSTLKALPTVRDHTSDQLGPGGDEFIPREYDDQGETKVNDMGFLQGGREYKIRTFTLPGRGDKLFMLATECARTLQYRDSYLLFNKNRSLYKIIASPKEKEELVAHDILPYSYRSRQIALVTARSMFRQFGSRVVKDGRRVRDDYWEAKARKQGFTEEDAAGEKRPGAARAREAAAAEALGNRNIAHLYGNIVYASDSNFTNYQPPMPPGIVATMPQMSALEAYDARYRDVQRPRIDNVGLPYTDTTRTSTEAEMASQASHAADHSKQVNIQGRFRRGIVSEYWHRPHEPPVTTPQQAAAEPVTTQSLPSPSYENADVADQTGVQMPQQRTSQTPSMGNRMYNQNQSSPHMQQNQMQSPMTSHSQSPHPQQQHMQPPQNFQQMSGQNMAGGQHLFGPGAGLRAMGGGNFNPMTMNPTQMYMANQNFMQQQHGGQPHQQNMYSQQQWQGFQ